MGAIGIADVLREMREVDVLVGEVQQMPRALPGAEGAERDPGLLLEQMQEARRRQPGLGRRSPPPSPARRRTARCGRSRAPRADRARAAAAHRRNTWCRTRRSAIASRYCISASVRIGGADAVRRTDGSPGPCRRRATASSVPSGTLSGSIATQIAERYSLVMVWRRFGIVTASSPCALAGRRWSPDARRRGSRRRHGMRPDNARAGDRADRHRTRAPA